MLSINEHSYNTSFNKAQTLYLINKTHKRTYKKKYNDHMNKSKVGHIKLDYKVTYNWFYELKRTKNFDKWTLFSDTNIINLQSLYLSYNQIKEIPKEICQLTNLQQLYLSYNQIKEIPKEICQLTNLQRLSLYNNQIKEIPKEICQLTKLQILYLYNNQIKEIPKEICQLTNLQILYLYNNQIKEIPEGINRSIIYL